MTSNNIQKFQNKHEDERCFVFGSAPSIEENDIHKVLDEHCFVANWFPIHYLYKDMEKAYHCISSPTPWWSGRLSPSFYHLSKSNQKAIRFWDSSFFFVNQKYHYFKEDELNYVKLIPRNDETVIPNLQLDIQNPVWVMGTVILDIILPVVYYMGFKEIYLVGCDCDFHLDEHPDWSNVHFYNLNWMPLWLQQHLRSGQSEGLKPHSLDNEYLAFKKYFEKNNRKIFNATTGGTLDVFERVDYDSLF